MGTKHQILTRLEELERKGGPLPKPLESYRRLLLIQSQAELQIDTPQANLSEEAASDRLKLGLPLLAFDDLTIDWSLFQITFEQVIAIFEEFSDLPGEALADQKSSDSYPTLLKKAARVWFDNARLPPSMLVSSMCLLEAVIGETLRPFLSSYSQAFGPLVDQERWRRNYCPICGGTPDFASLDKERGARWLLCSRCDAQWLFQRLECPCCATKDQNALTYFTDDEGLYRVYVCERCRHYLKAIDLRRTESEALLPLERLLTLEIDIQAQRDGYIPCGKAEPVQKSKSER